MSSIVRENLNLILGRNNSWSNYIYLTKLETRDYHDPFFLRIGGLTPKEKCQHPIFFY